MKENAKDKKQTVSLKEKAVYSVLIVAIAAMLYAADFFIFPLLFLGVLAFFIWKVFSIETQGETRQIFEFYLSANEILREDERRWFGFEIQDTVQRGESIVRSMNAVPPLVHFSLGALYQKLDDHNSAVKHLNHVVGESAVAESSIVFPPRELREYVRTLRKIERAPAEAPLTSAAVRSLERTRKNKAKQLLEFSLSQLEGNTQLSQHKLAPESVVDFTKYRDSDESKNIEASLERGAANAVYAGKAVAGPIKRRTANTASHLNASYSDRKPISEVLHDIYNDDVQ